MAHECLPMLTLTCPKKLAPSFTPRKLFVSRCKDTNTSVFGDFCDFLFYRKIWVFVLSFKSIKVNFIVFANVRPRHFFFLLKGFLLLTVKVRN